MLKNTTQHSHKTLPTIIPGDNHPCYPPECR